MSWIKTLPVMLLCMTACTQIVESNINEQPMQSKRVAKEYLLANDADLQVAADAWQRGGQSPMHIVATYKPGNRAVAEHNAGTAANRLKALGVSDVTTDVMQAHSDEVIAHMTALDVGAAPGCGTVPGVGPINTGYDFKSYRLGCSVDDMLAKQVASTPDLEGRVAGQNYGRSTDGLRAGNIVDTYRKGIPNEPLDGLASSDIAEGN